MDLAVTDASASTVWRWLHEDAIKPWQQQCWIYRRDPEFAVKAGRALDLYARVFEGKRLRSDEYVIQRMRRASCKPSGVATRPALRDPAVEAATSSSTSAAGRSRTSRRGPCITRNLFDRIEPKTGIEPFGRLVEQVMTSEPYASARTVYWIVDNGCSHAGKTSIKRVQDRWPTARLVTCPWTRRG